MAQVNVYKSTERWIAERFTLLDLRFVHAGVVVGGNLGDKLRFGAACLEYYRAARVAPSCPAGHLRHHLECPFVAAEIGYVHGRVGVEHSHHAHAVEVQAFRYHLRSDEYVGFSVAEG